MLTKTDPAPLLTFVLPLAWGLLLWAHPAGARTEQTAADLDQSAALAELAVSQNPGVTAIISRISALEQRIPRAMSWPDPVVAMEVSNLPVDSWVLGEHAMSGLQFKLQQTFPFPGKRRLRQEAARAEVQQHRQLLEERKVQLRAAVKRAYTRLALVRQLKLVTDEHLKLVDQFIDVVRVKYEVGKVSQHELLRLQVLQAKLQDEVLSFDSDDQGLTAAINATLHRPAEIAIQTPTRLKAPPPSMTAEELTVEASSNRPLLRWYTERANTGRAAARQAEREGYPDLTAWIGYRVRVQAGPDQGTDFFSAGLSVPLPLSSGRRWGTQQREQEAHARAAEAERQGELDRIRGAVGRHLAAWRRAAQQATSYREKLMPRAHQALDATFAAYQVDRADFASLFQSELQLLDFERTIRRAGAEAVLARVEVEALIGTPHQKWRQ